MMKLEPGAPLPHDLPPDAQRYRAVQEPRFRDRGGVALGIVVAAVAFGVGITALGAPDWLVIAAFAVAFLAMGWGRDDPSTTRYVPDERGEYVIEPHSVVAERLGALAAPKQLSPWARVLCGILGAAFLVVSALNFSDFLRLETYEVVELLLPLAAAIGLMFVAFGREVPSFETGEVPASPHFRELADPSRPLPDDAPISGSRATDTRSP